MESAEAFRRRVARAQSRGRAVVNLEARAKALGVKVSGGVAEAPRAAARVAAPAPEPDDDTPNFNKMTKDELYEYAQEWDLDGRSEMNKAELLAAVKASWATGE